MSSSKRAAGVRAADLVEDGMRLGLGTGSTVFYFLEALGQRIRDEGLKVTGVPTSIDTEGKCAEFGIALATLADVDALDLTIDGADEIDGDFQMIKGGGGALLREKVVAHISRREVIVVGAGKRVERLGTTFDLPLEVVPFSQPVVAREVERLGLVPTERRAKDGGEYRTDNGNAILDLHQEGGFEDARSLERELLAIPGVVEVGLFIDLADGLIEGADDGTCELFWKE